ncbi:MULTISPECIES: hypothetical protein [Clostridia]|uniref:Uncharacterized protein n=1 Tax=Lacrimispora xylanolytica TaxID=29375 RepID=A0ABY7ACI8_9FIRM|nr:MULTISPECIES: hypothetical protein [Clostridia]WAJ24070.1 hypothetical protein OW255_00650 [Lacrimispora xylanolytica]
MEELAKLKDQLSDLKAQLIVAEFGLKEQQINSLKVRIAEVQNQINNLHIQYEGDENSPGGRE